MATEATTRRATAIDCPSIANSLPMTFIGHAVLSNAQSWKILFGTAIQNSMAALSEVPFFVCF
jgi:hypothetical protein